MSWSETLSTSWHAIRTHTLRSLLTVLGILVGIAAVVVTVGLGLGTQKDVSEQISALGSNLLIVSPGSSTDSGGVRGGFGTAATLTLSDASALESDVAAPDVLSVAPEKTSSLALEANDTNWTTSVTGTTTSWTEVRSRELAYGDFFTDEQAAANERVVVLGAETAEELFGTAAVVGQTVKVDGSDFEIIGVLESAGSSSSTNLDDIALIPISTGVSTVLGGENAGSVSTIYVKAVSDEVLPGAYQEVTAILSNVHGITDADSADFTVSSQDALVDTATAIYRTLTVLLTGIAALSLLVGGIGVMNIMLVSVTERTREIGLRKALGAPPGAIRRQFLIEAAILGLGGGVLGVVVGLLATWLLPPLIGSSVIASAPVVLLALGVAVAIGLTFGVYPATRAARLTPIDALRSE
ncbi:MAG: ABC transporter permease [Microbacterium sp.]|uniref:ABC transporter permease n=1 Tax=Microbacterium sp. TaxID=51671 RepID=UPI0039E67155